MAGNKRQVARLATALGLTWVLERLPRKPSLLILNYHRVGDAANTPFDAGVFSCSAEELEQQVAYLKRHFHVASLDEAIELVDNRRPLQRPTVLISFDDGYLDNYQLAFPVLTRHGVPAAFFLPTAFIGTGQIPWWDVIASVVKRSPHTSISPRFAPNTTFQLSGDDREYAIAQLLQLYKHASVTNGEQFLTELEEACGVDRPSEITSPLFLSWDQAREMQAVGMSFGSHSHTHRILSKLPFTEQLEELRLSRQILERELDRTIDTLAYPVGDLGSYNADTLRALSQTGYHHAFSFVSGLNRPPSVDPYQLRRAGIFAGSFPLFRLRVALATLSFSSAPRFSVGRLPVVPQPETVMIEAAATDDRQATLSSADQRR